jgi:hypothetical protein
MSNRLEVNTRSLKQAVRKVGDVAGERLQRGLDEVADGCLGKSHPEVLAALRANPSLQSLSPTTDSLDRWAAVISGGSRIQVSVRAG